MPHADREQQRAAERRWYAANKAKVAAKKDRLVDEIAKCDVVCANCHRVRTWIRVRADRATTDAPGDYDSHGPAG